MSKWIKWEGGEMPVPKGLPIKVKYRNGAVAKCKAGDNHSYDWFHSDVDYDIVAYKIANGWVKHDGFYPEGLDPNSEISILSHDGEIENYCAIAIVWNSPVWAAWYKVISPAQTVTPTPETVTISKSEYDKLVEISHKFNQIKGVLLCAE